MKTKLVQVQPRRVWPSGDCRTIAVLTRDPAGLRKHLGIAFEPGRDDLDTFQVAAIADPEVGQFWLLAHEHAPLKGTEAVFDARISRDTAIGVIQRHLGPIGRGDLLWRAPEDLPLDPKGTISTTHLVVLVMHGPGGVGKDTVINRLGLRRLVSTTDRSPRQHSDATWEIDGQDYYFVHPHMFTALLESGAFIEQAPVLGYRKGLVRTIVEEALSRAENFVIRTDIQGAATWRAKMPGCISIRMLGLPPEAPLDAHRADLLLRLERRNAPAAERTERLVELEAEYAAAGDDYTVVNPWVDEEHLTGTHAIARLREIVQLEGENDSRPDPHLAD